MRARLALTLGVVLSSLGGNLWAEETAVKSRIVAVGLFKNGLAVVQRGLTVPGPGIYRLEDVPEPVHGTYWVESGAAVESSMKWREVEGPAQLAAAVHLQSELAGKKVTVHFRGGQVPAVAGTVLELPLSRGEEETAPPAKYLVLQTAKGRAYVEHAEIAFVDSEGQRDTVKRRKPVLFLIVAKAEKEAAITVSYLTRGLSWAPSYRVDITNPQALKIELSAVIKNELTDLDGAEVSLISGFPSMQFAHVTSPLSLRTSWAQFFQELGQRPDRYQDITSNRGLITQQAIPVGLRSPIGVDLSATPSGEGVDLHYQAIGKRTLAKDESLTLALAQGKSAYERIVEWVVPDARDESGRYSDQGQQDPWDAVKFKNPFAFPMTTGPAMVVAQGRFNGQRTSFWVNSGEETVLHVTKALSVRTRALEVEEQKKNGDNRDIVFIGGRTFRKSTIQGELAVSNHRKESIALVIRRRFSGDLLSADGNPKAVLREEGVYSVNKRNELIWSFPLKSGEEKKFAYRYGVLVLH